MHRFELGDRVLVYVHIPKTAGTSMRVALESVVGARAWRDVHVTTRWAAARDAEALRAYQLEIDTVGRELGRTGLRGIAINAPYGTHTYLERPACYLATLRKPIERLRSYWRFAYRTRARSARWRAYGEFDYDVRRILSARADLGLCNDQVRMIVGTTDFRLDRAHLELAKDRIRTEFLAVLDAATVDQTVPRLFGRRWQAGWQVPRLNVADSDDGADLPASAVAALVEANALDLELYAWFREAYLPELMSRLPDLRPAGR